MLYIKLSQAHAKEIRQNFPKAVINFGEVTEIDGVCAVEIEKYGKIIHKNNTKAEVKMEPLNPIKAKSEEPIIDPIPNPIIEIEEPKSLKSLLVEFGDKIETDYATKEEGQKLCVEIEAQFTKRDLEISEIKVKKVDPLITKVAEQEKKIADQEAKIAAQEAKNSSFEKRLRPFEQLFAAIKGINAGEVSEASKS